MALRIWLHRTAPDDIPAHWALELHDRCRRYNALPATGGVLDQDEWLLSMMETAAGVSALFDAKGKQLIGNQKRLDLHTDLGNRTAAFIELVNSRENDDAKS